MKTKLFIIAVFSAFMLNSCSNSSDSASIVGVWKYSREGAVVDGTEVLTPYSDNQSGCEKNKTEFKADGTMIDTHFNSSCTPSNDLGTYTKSGNTITTTLSDGTYTVTILELTSSILKIKSNDGYILEFTK